MAQIPISLRGTAIGAVISTMYHNGQGIRSGSYSTRYLTSTSTKSLLVVGFYVLPGSYQSAEVLSLVVFAIVAK